MTYYTYVTFGNKFNLPISCFAVQVAGLFVERVSQGGHKLDDML